MPNGVIRFKLMSQGEGLWREVRKMNGSEAQFLLHKPVDLQDQLALLQAHRQLLAREIVHKGIDSCFSYLPGSFSASAMTHSYAALAYNTRASHELPEWKNIFKQWVELKFAPNVTEDELLRKILELDELESQEMIITFIGCIAESLLQCIIKKHMKLKDIQQLSFKGESSMMVSTSATSLLSFLTCLLPNTLFNVVLKSSQLPPSLRGNRQLQCLFSNIQAEFSIKNMPSFSTLLKVLFYMILGKFGELSVKEECVIMDAAFRYFYLHHHDRIHKAAEIIIECFNLISESVRFAMTEGFLLFLRIATKLGKQKFVGMMQQKSSWLREISEKTNSKAVLGQKLQDIDPLSKIQPHKISIGRGQSVIRYFQCTQEYSIGLFKIIVEDLDIDVRIRHEGDLISKGAENMEAIFYEKVSGTFMEMIILPKRGIYSIEFDNTYSWINSKTIHFQRIILTPLSYPSPFLNDYFLNRPMNAVTPNYLIKTTQSTSVKAHIHVRQGLFSFTLENHSAAYQYQTDSLLRFMQKLQQIAKTKQVQEFSIGAKTLKSMEQIQTVLKEVLNGKQTKRKEQEVLIEIPLKY